MNRSKTLSLSLLCAVWLGVGPAPAEAQTCHRWTFEDLLQDAELQWLGMDVIAATATTPEEWDFLAALGVDGIYSDLVSLPGR